jgi:hypothetical protein
MTGAASPREIRGRVLRGCRLRVPETNDDYACLRNVWWDFNRLGLFKVISDLSALIWVQTYRAPRSLRGNVTRPFGYVRARGAW